MPTYEVTSPDGKTWEVSAPEGATQDQVLAYAKQQWSAQVKPPASVPLAQKAGAALMGIPRQLGLTARYGIEGLGNVANVVTDPIRAAVNPLLSAAGLPRAASTGQAATDLANAIGLPSPQTANERVVGDAARLVAGAGGMAGVAARAAPALSGAAQSVAEGLAARPGIQAIGGAAAGGAGGAVREAGGGPGAQFAASLAGGIAGGVGAAKGQALASEAARGIKNAMTPAATELARADAQINLTLSRSGIDWAQVPERIRQSMREDVAKALGQGQNLNADALRRLLVFRSTGTTPTVGMLTQDPGQITRELNLAKTAANSTDQSLQRLPALANQNVRTLLSNLDEAGAGRAQGARDTGASVIGALDARLTAAQQNINRLYQAARDSQGRSLPLEGGTFTARANALLDEANVGSFLPADIAKKMNDIATGKYPLTVDVAEQLKTSIGRLQRGSADGNARYALGLVRQALDEAPLQANSPLPAVPGTVPPSIQAGEESVAAFNAARSANRTLMQRIESNPALRAVHEGIEPDQFVQRFVIGKQASVNDVRSLAGELPPQTRGAVRDYIVRYLRDAATNSTDDVTKFSNAAYRKALDGVADKLPSFFSAEEIANLRNIGNAAKYMQAQPAGSAVNNSNSGALMLGKGLDMLDMVASRVPLGLRDTLSGTIQGIQQRQVLAPQNALALPLADVRRAPVINPLLAASLLGAEQPTKDKRGH